MNLSADALNSNGTASINGNIITTGAKSTGAVTLEATGQHISISQNKFNLGLQDLDLTLNEQGPEYGSVPATTGSGTSTTTTTINGVTTTTTTTNGGTPASVGPLVSGNAFVGTGTNTFNLTQAANPGPLPASDTAVINLATGNFVYNGGVNSLTGFANVALSGDIQGEIIGTSGNNTLSGANDTTTGTLVFEGNGGTNTITGGASALNVAYYAGRETQYTTHTLTSVIGGPTGDTSKDTLSGIQRLKFLSPTHVSDINNDGTGDLVFQNGTNGNLQIRLQGSTVVDREHQRRGRNPEGDRHRPVHRRHRPHCRHPVAEHRHRRAGSDHRHHARRHPAQHHRLHHHAADPAGGRFHRRLERDLDRRLQWRRRVRRAAAEQHHRRGRNPVHEHQGRRSRRHGGQRRPPWQRPPATGWKVISSGDFNGDGDSDILWQNTTTGQS